MNPISLRRAVRFLVAFLLTGMIAGAVSPNAETRRSQTGAGTKHARESHA